MPTVDVTDCQKGNFVNVRGENENGDELEYHADENAKYDKENDWRQRRTGRKR